ncbi:DUF418 domain-containing protein [Piscibacillus sp. B03]|uniref:DUF418 domain-containing protein n=1 Tax=Piscibacillus sp. B03 TaxID=3457430 RepID=UPI003FCED392
MNQNRISLIDAIRGFSLFGILLANLLIFQYGIYGKDELDYYSVNGIDLFTNYLIEIFIEGSFMPIFTFIFGYSIVLMIDKLRSNGLPIKRYLGRRFIGLIMIGGLHFYFLWEGDILLSYGVIGLILLMFIKRKPKTLLTWAVVIVSLMTIISFVPVDPQEDQYIFFNEEQLEAYLDDSTTVYQTGSYQEIQQFRLNEDPMTLETKGATIGLGESLFIIALIPFLLLPIFLLGIYAGKKQWLHQPEQHKRSYLIAASILLPIGFLMELTLYVIPQLDLTIIGDMSLSMGYIFIFAYLYTKLNGHNVIKGFEKVGKLSLSNYILQTIICTFIFYGYGLGMFGKLGVTVATLIGVVIYIIQVFLSQLYLKKFSQGPLERLIRMLVYLKFRSKPKNQDQKDAA